MPDKSEVTATCPFCRRPQTIPSTAGRVVCRHCQNAFAWDNKTASAKILPPPSLRQEKKPAPENRGQRKPPMAKTWPRRRIIFIILLLLLALAVLFMADHFPLQSPPKPAFPDNLDPASVLEEVGRQLKAITE